MSFGSLSRRQLVGSSMAASLGATAGLTRTGHAAAQGMMDWPVTQSIHPTLTPVAQMQAAPADEVHLAIAPNVPPAINRTEQRTWSVHLDVIEGIAPLDPENGISTEMWGFRESGQEDILTGSPGPVLRGRVGDYVTI